MGILEYHRCCCGLLLAVIVMMSASAQAQKLPPDPDEVEQMATNPAHKPKLKIIKKERSGIAAVPLVFYTPDTDFGGALGAHYFFRWKDEPTKNRPSSILLLALASFKGIWLVSLAPKLRWEDAAWQLDGDFSTGEFVGTFWGIGPDTPDSAEEPYHSFVLKGRIEGYRALFSRMYVGLFYEYERQKMTQREAGGQLQSLRNVPSTIYAASGLGAVLRWDNRDNEFAPRRGTFAQWSSGFFLEAFGSDAPYTEHILDVRQFIQLYKRHVLALQAYFSFVTDEPPFSKTSWLGGQNLLRGMPQGRYRDRNMIVFQSEYRFPLFWRISGVLFAGVGDVAHRPYQFNIDHFKFAWGGGIRAILNKQERIRMRFDVGVFDGVPSFYLVFGEAF